MNVRPRAAVALAAACALAMAALPQAGHGQTDWYNTDRGRPLRTQDAVAIERHAFEFQMTPFVAERIGSRTRWEFEPELAWGFAPRSQIAVGVPITSDRQDGRTSALAASGVHVSALHALNTETLGMPALAVTGAVVLPAGGRGPSRTTGDVGMLLTRTTAHGRVHANAHARLGDGGPVTEVPRWAAGLAFDRPLALQSILIAGEVTVEEPESGLDIVWRSAAGARVQLTPRVVIDAGVERTHSGDARGWRITGGSAIAFAIPGLQMRRAR